MTQILPIILLAGFGWLSYKKPLAALGAVLALLPTYLIRFQIGVPTTFLELLLLTFIITAFVQNSHKITSLSKLGAINPAIGLFLLAGIVSVFISPETAKALGQLKAFIIEPVLFFYAIVLTVKKTQDLALPLKFLFVSASAISFYGIAQYFTLFHLPMRFWGSGDEVRRIVSFFEYPNALALYLAPVFIFFASLAVKLKRMILFNNVGFFIGMGLQAVALLLTFSRGAWLAVGLVLLFLAFKYFPGKKIALALAALVVVILVVSPVRSRMLLAINDPSGIARMDLVGAGLRKVSQSPILGNGLYGFRAALQEQRFPGEILNYPHNIVLNFWLEMGLLGLFAFSYIIYLLAAQHKKQKNVWRFAAMCFMTALIIHGLVDVPYFKNDLSVLFWFMASIFYVKEN